MRPQRVFLSRQSISTRPSPAATARSPCISCKRPRSTRSWICQARNAGPRPWPVGRSRSMAPMQNPALQARGDADGALAEIERALSMSPNLAIAHGHRGATLIFAGRPKEGLTALETCIRLDPRDPYLAVRLLHIACGLYFCSEYEASIEASKRLIR